MFSPPAAAGARHDGPQPVHKRGAILSSRPAPCTTGKLLSLPLSHKGAWPVALIPLRSTMREPLFRRHPHRRIAEVYKAGDLARGIALERDLLGFAAVVADAAEYIAALGLEERHVVRWFVARQPE